MAPAFSVSHDPWSSVHAQQSAPLGRNSLNRAKSARFPALQLPVVHHPRLLQVLPGEAGYFGDACAGGVEGEQRGVVSRVGCGLDHALEGACGEEYCGGGVLFFRLAQPVPDVAGHTSVAGGRNRAGNWRRRLFTPGWRGPGAPAHSLRPRAVRGKGAQAVGYSDRECSPLTPISYPGAGSSIVVPARVRRFSSASGSMRSVTGRHGARGAALHFNTMAFSAAN